jgi:hypothetical protein
MRDRIIDAERRRLHVRLLADIDRGSFRSMTAVKVTDAGARAMAIGYTLGYREGVTVLIKAPCPRKHALGPY